MFRTSGVHHQEDHFLHAKKIITDKNLPYCTRVGTLVVATIYLQLIQNRYMF